MSQIWSDLVLRTTFSVFACAVGLCASMQATKPPSGKAIGDEKMRLGNFSVSLTVKDLAKSREFYEKLGFHKITGDGKKWAIMQNDTATIGLFEGIFEKNSLTFNPGWDRNSKTLSDFEDVRAIQKTLKKRGLALTTTADEST